MVLNITEKQLNIVAQKFLDGTFAGDVVEIRVTQAQLLATVAGSKILDVVQVGREPLGFVLLNEGDLYFLRQNLMGDGTYKPALCRLQPSINDFVDD